MNQNPNRLGIPYESEIDAAGIAARRDVQVARAFLRQAKAWTFRRILAEKNSGVAPSGQIRHIDGKYRNNRIESDRASLKKALGPMRGFRRLSSAKATLKRIEAIRTIIRGGVYDKSSGVRGEIQFIEDLFPTQAWAGNSQLRTCASWGQCDSPVQSMLDNAVAIPKNEKNPATSVTVVRMIEDATAGS